MQFIRNVNPPYIAVHFNICPIDAKFHHELSSYFYTMLLEVNEAWANQLIFLKPQEIAGDLAIARISFVLGSYEHYSAQTYFQIQELIEEYCNSFADSKGGYDSIKPI